MDTNYELELAWNFVNFTDRNIFLTGKAGTGKTTFLKRLKTAGYKRTVVVAPTGVAAINAGGVTIHSFFQLPFGPMVPERADVENDMNAHKFTRQKIDIIRSLDLLIIDEISMVRADLLDGIDRILRKYRNRFQPFGGVQLLLIGDLQQLAPVVRNDEWSLLKAHYSTLFFFGSKAYEQARVIGVELKQIFRQSDELFIGILNEIREDKLTQQSLEILNSRYQADFNPKKEDGYINLTTHNASADSINGREMEQLKAPAHVFKAEIEGIFPEQSYPTAAQLSLKEGAQVMFIKNDSSADKLYYNGKIGTIERIEEEIIEVRCPGDYAVIPVQRELWNNLKYVLDEESKELKEHIEGSFLQYPLRPAWAITIHKSQGLTFERAIIDAQAAFAHGQTYVALSRCKSMEGLVLSSPLSNKAVICDREVNGFSQDMSEHQPEAKDLQQSKKDYQLTLIDDLFNFKPYDYQVSQAVKAFHDNDASYLGDLPDKLKAVAAQCRNEIMPTAARFMRQVRELAAPTDDVESNAELQERLQKASAWFREKLKTDWQKALREASFETDNHALKKDVRERMHKMSEILYVKLALWSLCMEGFRGKEFLAARAKALLSAPSQPKESASRTAVAGVKHPALFRRLQEWRRETAEEKNVPAFQILTQKALLALVNEVPANSAELLAIKGVGKATIRRYGLEILQHIAAFAKESGLGIAVQTTLETEELKPKQPSHEISFQQFMEGKSVGRIATDRNLAETTIESHLAHYVETGELELDRLMAPDKVEPIRKHFESNPEQGLREAKEALGDGFSYAELRFVQAWMKKIAASS